MLLGVRAATAGRMKTLPVILLLDERGILKDLQKIMQELLVSAWHPVGDLCGCGRVSGLFEPAGPLHSV